MNLKFSLTIIAFAIFIYTSAQETGIHFEHNKTWQEIVAKAKKENKFIFIDGYTTWCGPCKKMATTIFLQKNVGEFYNKNFVNLKMQFDETKDDNDEVKAMRKTATEFLKKYELQAFPCFLFFNNDAEIIHKTVGSCSDTEFIKNAQDALNPELRYFVLKAKYEAGKNDSAFLKQIAQAALLAMDFKTGKKAFEEYCSKTKNIFTKENITLLYNYTSSTQDTTFQILINNPQKADEVYGRPIAHLSILNFIIATEIFPVATKSPTPVWDGLQKILTSKYPDYGEEAIMKAKTNYDFVKKDWDGFYTDADSYFEKYSHKIDWGSLNIFAWVVCDNCSDKHKLEKALNWSKLTLQETNNPDYLHTYANILYKLDRKTEAIAYETNALQLAKAKGEDISMYEESLSKMKE